MSNVNCEIGRALTKARACRSADLSSQFRKVTSCPRVCEIFTSSPPRDERSSAQHVIRVARRNAHVHRLQTRRESEPW